MTLSIVIICWNDRVVIGDCLRSIYATTKTLEFEVIVSDNGSTDGSLEFIRQEFPAVRLIENRQNLGFSRGNNVGIAATAADWVLILNPDTIIHDGALDTMVALANDRPNLGALGCRVLNRDGSYQESLFPFPTVFRTWLGALRLRFLGRLSSSFTADTYTDWKHDHERHVDWLSGCCILFRGDVLRALRGFDEQFFYHCEEKDLCYRVQQAGHDVVFSPVARITHLGGQSVKRFPIRFAIESYRNRYRYFYKHYGPSGARRIRGAFLAWICLRLIDSQIRGFLTRDSRMVTRARVYRALVTWNAQLDPVMFVERGLEPKLITDEGV